MEQTNHNYPKFEEGQVLTSKALNDYFGYLDEQQRLTRTQLLGVGIISGLEFMYDSNTITITKGTAVTPDGYLIDLPKDTTYTIACPYDKSSGLLAMQNPLTGKTDVSFDKVLDHVRYVLYENESDATKHNQNIPSEAGFPAIEEYIVALVVDFISQDTITECNELSCDIVQSNFQIEIRPILIDIEKIEFKSLQFCLYCGAFSLSGTLNSSKNYLKGESINTYLKNTIKEVLPKVKEGINVLTTLSQFNVWNCFFLEHVSSIQDHIAKLSNHVKTLEDNISTFSAIPDYYLSHVMTLCRAFAELVVYYNEIVKKYNCYTTEWFNRVVLLGRVFDPKALNFSTYRQSNNGTQNDKQFVLDCQLFLKHLNRLFSLFDSFIFDPEVILNQSYRSIQLYKYNPHSKLGDHPRPLYYETEISQYWYAHLFREGTSFWAFDHGMNLIDGFDDWHDCLIFEDYYGESIYSLNTMIKNYNKIHYPIKTEYIEEIDLNTFIEKYKKDYDHNMTLDLFKKSPILQECTDYEETLVKIKNNEVVEDSQAERMIRVINKYFITSLFYDDGLPLAWYNVLSEKDILRFCKDYLMHCTYYYRRIIMIGGCPYNGKLVIYYKINNKDERVISLILGADDNERIIT